MSGELRIEQPFREGCEGLRRQKPSATNQTAQTNPTPRLSLTHSQIHKQCLSLSLSHTQTHTHTRKYTSNAWLYLSFWNMTRRSCFLVTTFQIHSTEITSLFTLYIYFDEMTRKNWRSFAKMRTISSNIYLEPGILNI